MGLKRKLARAARLRAAQAAVDVAVAAARNCEQCRAANLPRHAATLHAAIGQETGVPVIVQAPNAQAFDEITAFAEAHVLMLNILYGVDAWEDATRLAADVEESDRENEATLREAGLEHFRRMHVWVKGRYVPEWLFERMPPEQAAHARAAHGAPRTLH